MTVGYQDAVKAAESNSGPENLPLRSFAAIDEEAKFPIADDLRGQTTVDRGR